MTLSGIDTSSYQGLINWPVAIRNGIQFAAVKATEGTGYQDVYFPKSWEALFHAGIPRLAYHYLHPSISGKRQADYLHYYVHGHGRFREGDGVLLDLEATDGESPAEVILCAEEFVEQARRGISKQVVLYTGPWFWAGVLGNPSSPLLRSCPLWVADYGVEAPDTLGWPVWSFWQWSSQGVVPGVPNPCDRDQFNGDLQQLRRLLQWPPPA